jgi:hypothetical protein
MGAGRVELEPGELRETKERGRHPPQGLAESEGGLRFRRKPLMRLVGGAAFAFDRKAPPQSSIKTVLTMPILRTVRH